MRLLQVVWAPTQDVTYVPAHETVAAAVGQSIRSEVKVLPGSAPQQAQTSTAANAIDADPPLPGSRYEVLIVDGAVTRFKGDYRAAIADIERLVDRFNKANNMKAEIVRLPVDVKPTAILRANTPSTGEASEVRFTLKIVRNREIT